MSMRRLWPVVLVSVGLTACSMGALPPPEASLDNIQAIRAAALPPLAVGAFTPGPGGPTAMDRALVIRAGVQSAPGGSFARYLGDTLAAELKGAGRLDPSSDLKVTGVITHSHLDSTIGTARAELSARFTLTRGSRVLFDRTFDDDATWTSDWVGAAAIPDAFNHYLGLFPRLVGQLLTDPDFRKAVAGAQGAPVS